MILGYKKVFPFNGKPTDFKSKINTSLKIHSIREDKNNRWKPGMIIQHAYGVRTKNYECFAEGQCVSIQKIRIEYLEWYEFEGDYTYLPEKSEFYIRIFIDDVLLTTNDFDKLKLLAQNDGFDRVDDFFRWFNKPFFGRIIHWTDFKY